MKRWLRIYVPFTRAGIQEMMAYRMNFLVFFCGESLYCFVMYYLWKAVFRSGGSSQFMGFNMMEMTFFIFLSNIVGFLVGSDSSSQLGREIKDGSVIMRMIKPVNLDFSFLFMELGHKLLQLIGLGIPIIAGLEIYQYVMSGQVTLDAVRVLMFLLSTAIGYLLSFYLNLCFGFMAFFFKNLWGFNMLKEAVIRFLSGAVIPIAFLPALVQKVMYVLPFASLSYTPVMVYIGKYDMQQSLQAIGLQVVWLALIYGLSRLIWQAAVRYLTVQGG